MGYYGNNYTAPARKVIAGGNEAEVIWVLDKVISAILVSIHIGE